MGNGGEATFGEGGGERRQGKEGVTGQGRERGSDDAFRFSFDDAFLGKKMSPHEQLYKILASKVMLCRRKLR